jgi:hypothetical protein
MTGIVTVWLVSQSAGVDPLLPGVVTMGTVTVDVGGQSFSNPTSEVDDDDGTVIVPTITF